MKDVKLTQLETVRLKHPKRAAKWLKGLSEYIVNPTIEKQTDYYFVSVFKPETISLVVNNLEIEGKQLIYTKEEVDPKALAIVLQFMIIEGFLTHIYFKIRNESKSFNLDEMIYVDRDRYTAIC